MCACVTVKIQFDNTSTYEYSSHSPFAWSLCPIARLGPLFRNSGSTPVITTEKNTETKFITPLQWAYKRGLTAQSDLPSIDKLGLYFRRLGLSGLWSHDRGTNLKLICCLKRHLRVTMLNIFHMFFMQLNYFVNSLSILGTAM